MLSLKLLISASTTTTIVRTLLLLYAVGNCMLVLVAAADNVVAAAASAAAFDDDNFAISSKNATINAESVRSKENNSFSPHNVASINNNNYNNNNNTSRILQRGKRYLDFTKGTRMSWRTTVKNNILKVNTLWGHGFGFRANFPFADKADRIRPFFKRDIFHALEDVLDGHGFDGRACVLKSFCTAILDSESHLRGGMLFKLLQMIFRTGFDGQACVLKAFCAAHMGEGQGMLFKLLRHVFTLDSHDKRHLPYLREENCAQILHGHCPLSFNNISPYTDD